MKLINEQGTVYLDYGYIKSNFDITHNKMHNLLTKHLIGFPYRNKKVYAEHEVIQLFNALSITKK